MKGKVKVSLAKRKHRLEMKSINEKCLAENYNVEFWEGIIAHKNSFVICIGSLMIGYILVDKDGHVVSFAVLKDYQGKGHGAALLAECLTHLGKSKCPSSSLNVRVSNTNAIKLYERNGYVKKETTAKYYADGEDAHVMTKTF